MKLLKPFILLIVFIVFKDNAKAQFITHFELENISQTVTGDTILPSYPGGGDAAFFQFLNKQIQYPEAAKYNQLQGSVIVEFIVKTDSTISDIKVLRDVGGGCKEEVLRVLNKMPLWVPGKTKGKAIKVNYFLRVKFNVEYIEPPRIEQIKQLEIKN